MRIHGLYFFLGLISFLIFTLDAKAGQVLDRITSTKTMTAAYAPGWPPVAYLDDKNELVGFDVDVGKEIAKRLGATMKPITVAWEFIESGRWGNRWDIAIGSMTPTMARAEVLDFPGIYWYSPASFAVHKNNKTIHQLNDLNGKTIGVCGGCSTEDFLNNKLQFANYGDTKPNLTIKPGLIKSYDSEGAYFDDLKLGDGKRLDAILSNLPTLLESVKTQPFRIIEQPAFYEPLAVALDKGDKELSDKVKQIITDMHQDGTLTALSKKWFNGKDWSVVGTK
ncbi:MAG: transporter substrate-binding domain-containing protein [Alphaproteobacteria bacterium]|nr:transporter substrate-binding domain-containing protein [Alphaproteobacteria bacterium]